MLTPPTFVPRKEKANADYLTEPGAAVQLTDETLAESLLPTVRGLLFDPERLAGMAAAAAALDRPEAATDLARLILAQGAPVAQEEALC